MNNDILDEPIIENKLPPVNASTLLFIALTFIGDFVEHYFWVYYKR